MLQGRLTRLTLAVASLATAAGCAGADGTDRGAIREAVIEPGITAIGQATQLACGSDAATLRTAMEAYELLEQTPTPDEATLVEQQFVREESDLWDIVDGRLVPTDPGCGTVAPDAPDAPDAVDIVTSTEPPQTADEVYAGFSGEQITAVGGPACATELAAIFSGAERYVVEIGSEPADLQQLVDQGYLEAPPALWQLTDDQLVPAPESGCVSL
jgi:hypothetical protein